MYVGAFPIYSAGYRKGYTKLRNAEGILLCRSQRYDIVNYDVLYDQDDTFAVNFSNWRGKVSMTSVIKHINRNFTGFIYDDFIFKVVDCGNSAKVLIWSDGTAIHGNINKKYELHLALKFEDGNLYGDVLRPVAFIEESSSLYFKLLDNDGSCLGLTRCSMSKEAVMRMLI